MFDIYNKIRESPKYQPWFEALDCLLYALVGNLMPFYIGALLFRVALFQWTGWLVFFRNGEFSIYSASFLSSTLYLMHKSPRGKIKVLIPWLCLVVATALFACVTLRNIYQNNIILDELYLFRFTLILFIISIILFYITNVIENRRLTTDLRKLSQQHFEAFRKSFEELREAGKNNAK